MKRFLMTMMIATAAVTLKAGDTAPAFTATATDGSTINLADYAGKQNVVLYFYPEDMTGGCTREACSFRDDLSKYAAANTAILGVSMDDQAKHQQFTQKDSLTFPLLVDTSGTICNAYGVPFSGHHAHRWTFLIGKDGKIVKTYHDVDPRIHSAELLADIASHASN